jgi:hypothetical protein
VLSSYLPVILDTLHAVVQLPAHSRRVASAAVHETLQMAIGLDGACATVALYHSTDLRFRCSASGSGGSLHNCVSVPRREQSEMYQTRHSQRAVVSCEQLFMSYDSDTVPSLARGPVPV